MSLTLYCLFKLSVDPLLLVSCLNMLAVPSCLLSYLKRYMPQLMYDASYTNTEVTTSLKTLTFVGTLTNLFPMFLSDGYKLHS